MHPEHEAKLSNMLTIEIVRMILSPSTDRVQDFGMKNHQKRSIR